jgi:isoleucyl-tRNA synthetase
MNFSEKEAITKRKEVYLKPGELREIKFKNFPYNEGGEVDIHRPYVDEIFLRCPKCQRGMKRIKEVVDVWFDSGAMPFAQYHWPFEKRLDYPADFIAEGLDQTRGWFYTLHAVGTLMGRGPAYKNVMSLGLILDEKRKKMSKSKGNVIDPWDIVNKQGADIFRWYFFTVNSPAEPKLFSVDALLERSGNFFVTLLNILRFFELYAKPGDRKPRIETAQVIDRWILSKLNSLADKVTKALDEYDLNGAARPVETFVIEDFSNWWLRRSRDRFQRPKNSAALERDVKFLCYLLSEISKILAPFIPFAAEHIYKKVNNKKESVHLEDWPKPKKKFINLGLESRMEELRNFVALGLAQRKAANIKVRQPLTAVTLKKSEKFEPELEKLILAELNVKSINYNPAQEEELTLDKKITPELLKESYAREVMRQIQDMRKEAGYKLDEKIYAAWASDNKDVVSMMGVFGKEIAENTLLMEFGRGHRSKEAFDVEKETDLGPQAKIWLGIRRKK